jgi:CheY-like chemotaxis protein
MAKNGPIVIVEDDHEDQEILETALREIGTTNALIFFTNGPEAFMYLKSTRDQPLLILSDINLPRQNGIEFKKQIDEDPILRSKSIPFIFFSTSVDKTAVNQAFKKMTVQGFFQKSNSFQELTEVLNVIITYWKMCHHPNS